MVHKACCCNTCCCYKVENDEYTVHQIEGLGKYDCLCPDDPECPDPSKCKCGLLDSGHPIPDLAGKPIWSMWKARPCGDDTCEVGCCCYRDEITDCWRHRDTDSGLPEENKIGGCFGHPSGKVPPYWHGKGITCEKLDREALQAWGSVDPGTGEETCLENCGDWDVGHGEYGESLGVDKSACGPACGASADVWWWREGIYRDEPYRTRRVPFDSYTTEGPCCPWSEEGECYLAESRWHCEEPIPECSCEDPEDCPVRPGFEEGGLFGTEGDTCGGGGCFKGIAVGAMNCNAAPGGSYKIIFWSETTGEVDLGTNANDQDLCQGDFSLPGYALDYYEYDEEEFIKSIVGLPTCGCDEEEIREAADAGYLVVNFKEELNDLMFKEAFDIRFERTSAEDELDAFWNLWLWYPWDSKDEYYVTMDGSKTIVTEEFRWGVNEGEEDPIMGYIDPLGIMESECGIPTIVPVGACCDPEDLDEAECQNCVDRVPVQECLPPKIWSPQVLCDNVPPPCACGTHPCCIAGTPCCPEMTCNQDWRPGTCPDGSFGGCGWHSEGDFIASWPGDTECLWEDPDDGECKPWWEYQGQCTWPGCQQLSPDMNACVAGTTLQQCEDLGGNWLIEVDNCQEAVMAGTCGRKQYWSCCASKPQTDIDCGCTLYESDRQCTMIERDRTYFGGPYGGWGPGTPQSVAEECQQFVEGLGPEWSGCSTSGSCLKRCTTCEDRRAWADYATGFEWNERAPWRCWDIERAGCVSSGELGGTCAEQDVDFPPRGMGCNCYGQDEYTGCEECNPPCSGIGQGGKDCVCPANYCPWSEGLSCCSPCAGAPQGAGDGNVYGTCCLEGHCCDFRDRGYFVFCSFEEEGCEAYGCPYQAGNDQATIGGYSNDDMDAAFPIEGCSSSADCCAEWMEDATDERCENVGAKCCEGCCQMTNTFGECYPWPGDPCEGVSDAGGLLFIPPAECSGEYLCPPCCPEDPDCELCDAPFCRPECEGTDPSEYLIMPAPVLSSGRKDDSTKPCCISGDSPSCIDVDVLECGRIGGEVAVAYSSCDNLPTQYCYGILS